MTSRKVPLARNKSGEWLLERRQAQKYLRRVKDQFRSDAEQEDQELTLHVVRQQRLRIRHEISGYARQIGQPAT